MQVVIRSAEDYWKNYILAGVIEHKYSNTLIKGILVDCFQKELYGLVQMRAGVDDFWAMEDTEANRKTIVNALKDIRKKWANLCRRCAKYKETSGLITEDDLTFPEKVENRVAEKTHTVMKNDSSITN